MEKSKAVSAAWIGRCFYGCCGRDVRCQRYLFYGWQPDQFNQAGLKINQGDPAILLRRLRLADGVPMAIETIYLNDKIFHPVLEEYTGGSFYQFMHERFGIIPYRAIQSIEVVKLLRWEADLLGNPELDMALLMHRQTYDENNQPIEYVISKYRGDKYQFHIELYHVQNVVL